MEPDILKQYRVETEPDAMQLARIQHQIHRKLQPQSSLGWFPVLAIPALAALLWALAPAIAPEEQVVGIPAESLAEASSLMLVGSGGTQALLEGKISLSWDGSGKVLGTKQAPLIDWSSGRISVEVEPNQGIALSVQTIEALVQVVGTGFLVNRDVMGTRVEVLHGRVQVDCMGGSSRVLAAGEQILCLPTTGAGLLARARALQSAGAPDMEVFQTIEQGLMAEENHQAIQEELQVLKIQTLGSMNRVDEALSEADRYLTSSTGETHRIQEVRRYAAYMAVAQQNCEAALRYLEPIMGQTGAEAPSVEDLQRHAWCVSKNHPERARKDLETALKLSNNPTQRAAIEAALHALGKTD